MQQRATAVNEARQAGRQVESNALRTNVAQQASRQAGRQADCRFPTCMPVRRPPAAGCLTSSCADRLTGLSHGDKIASLPPALQTFSFPDPDPLQLPLGSVVEWAASKLHGHPL